MPELETEINLIEVSSSLESPISGTISEDSAEAKLASLLVGAGIVAVKFATYVNLLKDILSKDGGPMEAKDINTGDQIVNQRIIDTVKRTNEVDDKDITPDFLKKLFLKSSTDAFDYSQLDDRQAIEKQDFVYNALIAELRKA